MQRCSTYNCANFARRRDCQSNSLILIGGQFVKKTLLGGHGKVRRTVRVLAENGICIIRGYLSGDSRPFPAVTCMRKQSHAATNYTSLCLYCLRSSAISCFVLGLFINCFIQHVAIDAVKLYFPYHNSGWDFSIRDWDLLKNLPLGLGFCPILN